MRKAIGFLELELLEHMTDEMDRDLFVRVRASLVK